MTREFERLPGGEHTIQISLINGENAGAENVGKLTVHNIGKGGFRFETRLALQLEDRVQVMLSFPDGYQQQVLGRICYCDELDDGTTAYGFSVLSGFYSLDHAAA